ncbi:MAG: tRNA pseudouridine(55) synthase TruB [Sphingomonadaceae bacterium]|uniref:tRNA pseudouridine(55) synthase TruB n=1 Tax=Thermaurantiacus sp. TaxID=2820283 RepID=UPI00298EFF74|nr:tRNA pseudouridine(55) synthase TruB [Thermaurantiacus sp.]MCS6986260.1 tRNA pseudouridine(55) synthase TruB [Sphingomonadaceae bacterium]MDW8415707.1 tRNA pseudouridine(55) synthase TruB [Thermaurantiacus sp.]
MTGRHGWLVIDKPVGPTSADVVNRIRRALAKAGHRRLRVGHGGTLDPLATGVLPLALGEATKLAGFVLDGPKSYRFALRFGIETTTGDLDGEVVGTSPVRPTAAEISAALPRFRGAIGQRPPAFSAVKVDGRRAHALARAGLTPRLDERTVVIDRFELVGQEGDEAWFEVDCSKGTYVRSLGPDLARALGTVGTVSRLVRTRAGPFTIAQAMSLDRALELVQGDRLEQALMPLAAGLDDIPVLAVSPEEALRLRQGQAIPATRARSGLHLATRGAVPVALVDVRHGCVTVVRGLNLD